MTRHSTTPVTGGARGNSTVGVAPLGETLIEAGSITRTQLETALASQRESGDHRLLGEVLVSLGFADEATIAEGLAAYENSLRRRLIWLVFVIPTVVVVALVWILNFS